MEVIDFLQKAHNLEKENFQIPIEVTAISNGVEKNLPQLSFRTNYSPPSEGKIPRFRRIGRSVDNTGLTAVDTIRLEFMRNNSHLSLDHLVFAPELSSGLVWSILVSVAFGLVRIRK